MTELDKDHKGFEYRKPDVLEFIMDFQVTHEDKYLDDSGNDMISGKLTFKLQDNYIPNRSDRLFRALSYLLRIKYKDMYLKYKYKMRITYPRYNITEGKTTFLIEVTHGDFGY
jgi:hypothetical protein